MAQSFKVKYNIVRHYFSGGKAPRVMKSGLNIREAQAHCSDPRTRKEGIYFDGYQKVK